MSNPFGEDFCEYVHNPLMRQFQDMIRLLQSLRESQSDCNDLECFPVNQASANPLVNGNLADPASQIWTYGGMLLLWVSFMALLFLMRPSSMRKKTGDREPNKRGPNTDSSLSRGPFFKRDDDDDNSTVS